jgi:ATP-dependent protease ClpP protease subunit
MNNVIPFYRIRAEAGDEPAAAELLIFDVIGDWEDFGEVGAKAFARDLAALPKSVKRLDIHINSPGGSVSEANAIYSRLADHPSTKNVYVDGLAASAATLVAMVGHKIYIRANATMMIHLPIALAIGNADDMRQTISALDSVTESMLNLYTKRTGSGRDDIRSWMKAETWMSADVAVEKGFADEVRGVVKAAAVVGEKRVMFNGVTFDLSRFHNVPAFTATSSQPQPRSNMNPAQTPPAAAPPNPTAEATAPAPPAPPTPTPTPTPPPAPAPTPTPTPTPPTSERELGVQAERTRIAALQKYDRPATHALITAAIADGRSVSDITEDLFKAMEKTHQNASRHDDASILSQIPPSGEQNDGDRGTEFGKLLTAKVKTQLKGRGQQSVLHSRS